eukprot:TRINITY_DN5824_c0_g2_i1.p1 TRINITY_DN5824_c0_g2~~TRINITY_DN5824_c0_g2_i1.p1  ORF type:complete len:425 (+),score=102.73 TRINITY_DN5824_c0_g2_i1:83-1357(+)
MIQTFTVVKKVVERKGQEDRTKSPEVERRKSFALGLELLGLEDSKPSSKGSMPRESPHVMIDFLAPRRSSFGIQSPVGRSFMQRSPRGLSVPAIMASPEEVRRPDRVEKEVSPIPRKDFWLVVNPNIGDATQQWISGLEPLSPLQDGNSRSGSFLAREEEQLRRKREEEAIEALRRRQKETMQEKADANARRHLRFTDCKRRIYGLDAENGILTEKIYKELVDMEEELHGILTERKGGRTIGGGTGSWTTRNRTDRHIDRVLHDEHRFQKANGDDLKIMLSKNMGLLTRAGYSEKEVEELTKDCRIFGFDRLLDRFRVVGNDEKYIDGVKNFVMSTTREGASPRRRLFTQLTLSGGSSPKEGAESRLHEQQYFKNLRDEKVWSVKRRAWKLLDNKIKQERDKNPEGEERHRSCLLYTSPSPRDS